MKKIFLLLAFCLFILSVFVGCDNNKQGTNLITVTLDSSVLGKKAETIDTVGDKSIILPSGENLWETEAYSFSGWSTSKEGAVAYKAGDKYSSSSNTTLYAVWTANPNITYNPNGGTGEAITEYYKNGSKVTVKNTSFTKDGYILSYWSTSSDGTDTYTMGQDITLTQDLTLYAVWVENKDTITITFNSGTIEKDSETVGTVEDNIILLPSGDSLWTTDDYTFSGWSETADGGVKYKAGEKYTASSSATLYAVWSTNPKITYDPNGGNGEKIVESYKGGSKVTIKSTSFTNDGYTLSYWSTSANGSEIYTFGQEITLTKDLTLYAAWVENAKSVSVTFNSGILEKDAQIISVDKGKEILLPAGDSLWTVNGYTFSGWAETATGKIKYKAGSKYSAKADITLYAVWTENKVTLAYNANGGNGSIESVTVAQGTEVTIADENALSRDGYILSSWTDGATNYDLGFKLILSSNITLYAVWTEKTHIKYYNGDELIAKGYLQDSGFIGIGDGSGLSKAGYILYWTTNSDGTGTLYDIGDKYTGSESIALYAQWQQDDGKLTYTFDETSNTYSVKAASSEISGIVTIPSTYKGKKVTAIDELAFKNCNSVTKIVIPDTVTLIGGGAFSFCRSLSSVNIPNGVTELKACLFEDCAIGTIKIPDSVIVIGDYAFFHSGIQEITIPKNVISIGECAFIACPGLTKVNMSDSVISIGDRAFSICANLTEITIPSSVTSIGENAFSECSGLKSIYIDNIEGAEGAPTGANWGADSATVYWTGNYDITSEGVFTVTDKNKIGVDFVIPNKVRGITVTSIGPNAFDGCCNEGQMTSITMPDSITSIGSYAFNGCKNLKTINIPGGIKTIGQEAFNDCDSLTLIYIDKEEDKSLDTNNDKWGAEKATIYWATNYIIDDNGVLTVKDKSLVTGSIILPDSVTGKKVKSIGKSAFGNCEELTSVVIPEGVESIEDYAFEHCNNLISIEIPESVVSLGSYTFMWCSALESATINGPITTIEACTFLGCYNLTSFNIPKTVTQIEERAFMWCSTLKGIELPERLETIGEAAFYCCLGNESIEIPNTVTSIGSRAFLGWSKLKSITIPNSVTMINNGIFSECKNLESVTIPDTVTTIGDYAFSWCESLKSITIPNSVTTIGEDVFWQCTSLKTITIKKTEGSISGSPWGADTSITTICWEV